ncbi:MAG: ubiquinone biosynthesis regulatory protein kinase UbiB [Porticoccus sp.]|jgi:ubiquinone biosynthesis protein|uniref:ubiquinone biosynthesis regulatory protein kinase UbiB n=1 Tax=Porticoccus hydrocarbonoclasticus TaxID=1073414 RepID=UPI00056BFE20|nr:ubiquinone biosynthesis regulatory protein kinase UbiB [Porticoccus hydrocarbonoclasticus]MBG58734.1 ubiquinone biosynthesis regulatory protein kinase UbiB [Porticoccus sp.]|tara:strand:- start:5198 stop:6808 length:1611 start_codon:yes stop_codon:yes gene_type:complete
MSRIRRLSTILRTTTRYRLDTFLDAERLPWGVRLLLRFNRLLPAPKQPRGERLRQAMEDLGPIFIKFGQLLSTRPDLIPPDICQQLDKLQDNVPPFDKAHFVAIVEQALENSVDNLFLHFDREPLASASVAQVHAATLHNGREVVVKAIRPGIEKTIGQDIRLLFTMARWLESNTVDGRRMRLTEVVSDYQNTILDELNLQREGANASMLRRNFDRSPLLYVPEVFWSHTNEKVLVMERIYAIPVTDITTLQQHETNFKVLAERGVEIFFSQVFEHNFFHADMHPGNIFVDPEDPQQPKYLAVDCAIMGTLTEADQYYLARNLLAIFRRDYQQVAELHVLSGWVPEGTNVGEFAAAIRTVCEPIFERPLREISFGLLLVNLFRTARRFDMEVQPSLVLLQKTLLNIEGLGRQLYPDLDLWATAHPFLERWLKERFKPNALMEQLKRHGPEWLEQFPQLPQLVFQTLERLQAKEVGLKEIPASVPVRPGQRRRTLLGAALIGIGLGSAFPEWTDTIQQMPVGSLVLAGLGLLLLIVR